MTRDQLEHLIKLNEENKRNDQRTQFAPEIMDELLAIARRYFEGER